MALAALLVLIAFVLWYPRWVVSRGGMSPFAPFWASLASRTPKAPRPPAAAPRPAPAARRVVERQAYDGRTERLTWDETGALLWYELFEGRYEWRWGPGSARAYEVRWSSRGYKERERGRPPASLPPEVDAEDGAPGPGEQVLARFAEHLAASVGAEYFKANYTLVPERYELNDQRGIIRVGMPDSHSRRIALAYAYRPARRLDPESYVGLEYEYCADCPSGMASGSFRGGVADVRGGGIVEPAVTRKQALVAARKVRAFQNRPSVMLMLRPEGWVWRVMCPEETSFVDAVTGRVIASFGNHD